MVLSDTKAQTIINATSGELTKHNLQLENILSRGFYRASNTSVNKDRVSRLVSDKAGREASLHSLSSTHFITCFN